jgi:hypothetical protein
VQATQGGQRISLSPSGRVRVDPSGATPNALVATAQGNLAHSLSGLTITWVPTLVDPADFARALGAGSFSAVVQPDGSLIASQASNRFALQPAPAVQSVTGQATGFGFTEAGVLSFTSALGARQLLYPAAADFAGLLAAVRAADANAQVLGLGDGRIRVVLGGQTYTLRPDYALLPQPAARIGQPFWIEGGRLFLPVSALPGLAQGFGVQ